MKTNFKKLALQVGVSAALVAGSMAAHAAITTVPAPAQLVPLFYYNDDGTATDSTIVDTRVRITVPMSVGSDTVINILSGEAYGLTNITANTKWGTDSAGLQTSQKVHWFWLNDQSQEVLDGTVVVTPDDVAFLSAREVNQVARDTLNGEFPSGQPGYLVLVNDSAAGGGAPTFQFVADAWIENDGYTLSLPQETSIPVFAMADDVDTSITYPTPTNNVVENNGSPNASPVHTAIRTSSTAPGANVRVVDIPLFDSSAFYNTVVAWADDVNTNSLASGISYRCDTNESCQSFTRPGLTKELNFLPVGWTTTSTGTTFLNAYGIQDVYATNIPQTTASAQTAANEETYGNAGFLKMVLKSEDLPADASALTPGAYSSVVLFNLPAAKSPVEGVVNTYKAPALGIDTGFFATQQ